MSHKFSSPFRPRPLLVMILALVGAVSWLFVPASSALRAPGREPSHSAYASPADAPPSVNIRHITLATKDLVYDQNTQKIYASVPSSAGSNGNSITPIDPFSGTIGTSVFVGSEPGKMAISDNGQYIYVTLDGAAAVRRFDVASQTAKIQFAVGTDPFYGPLYVEDMAVAPGNPHMVAIAKLRKNISPRHGGVSVYDDGVIRSMSTPDHIGSNVIAFSGSPSVLYGLDNETNDFDFDKDAIASCGIGVYNGTSIPFAGYDMRFDNGRIYTTGGLVFDPEAETILGTFTVPHNTFYDAMVAPDSKTNRVYFLTRFGSVTISAYDMQTFLPVGSVDIPDVTGKPASFIRWGDKGFAFRTETDIYILQSDLIPQTITPTPAPTPTQPRYSVSGHVAEDGNNKGIAGVTITLTGAQTATTTTDANGNYFIGNLDACETYTVKPTHPLYFFAPNSQRFTPGTNAFGIQSINSVVDFDALPLAKTMQFSADNFTVNEGDGQAIITVTRQGDNTSAATIDYSTSDGTAQQRTKYTAASGTLNFAPGETSKTFGVLILDNGFVEGDETVNLSLSNPTGGVLLGNRTYSTLTIIDNDTVTQAGNPVDDAQYFVRQQYADFLNRQPDADGLGYWTSEITRCGTDAQCIHDRRVGVADAFFFEAEFQKTGGFIYRVYKAAYGRRPTYSEFMSDRGKVVAGPGLEQSKTDFALAFVQRTPFLSLYPRSQTADQFVDALLASIKKNSGLDLTNQRSTFISFYEGTDNGRAAILKQIADGQALTDAEYNQSFVLMEYFGYLRREPDQGGFDFWLAQVNKFPLRDIAIQHAMACSFITSGEYQTRFSSTVTHTNRECPQ